MEKLGRGIFLDRLDTRVRKRLIPRTAVLELSYGCNLRCVHCLNPTHQAVPKELRPEEIRRILQEIHDLGVPCLSFTGGEPLTRPDFFEIAAKAKELGFLVSMLSNATRINPEIARRLQGLGLFSLALSIYGVTQETYERITRVPGSYERFRESLGILAASGIPVILRMPLMSLNESEIEPARALAESLGFDFAFSVEIHPRQDGDPGPLAFRLNAEQKMRIHALMKEPLFSPPAEDACDPKDGEEFVDCDCGQGRQFAISPYGEMNFCTAFPIPKYDLRRGSVAEGWEFLKNIRRDLRPNEHYECPGCEFRNFCRQGRNDAWLETGDPSRCLPHFKDWARREKEAYRER